MQLLQDFQELQDVHKESGVKMKTTKTFVVHCTSLSKYGSV